MSMCNSNPLIVFLQIQYISRSLIVTCNWLLQAGSTRLISSFHHLNAEPIWKRLYSSSLLTVTKKVKSINSTSPSNTKPTDQSDQSHTCNMLICLQQCTTLELLSVERSIEHCVTPAHVHFAGAVRMVRKEWHVRSERDTSLPEKANLE